MSSIDTLQTYKILIGKGMPQEQADEFVKTMSELQRPHDEHVTMKDLKIGIFEARDYFNEKIDTLSQKFEKKFDLFEERFETKLKSFGEKFDSRFASVEKKSEHLMNTLIEIKTQLKGVFWYIGATCAIAGGVGAALLQHYFSIWVSK